jgi:hypothetical protein
MPAKMIQSDSSKSLTVPFYGKMFEADQNELIKSHLTGTSWYKMLPEQKILSVQVCI